MIYLKDPHFRSDGRLGQTLLVALQRQSEFLMLGHVHDRARGEHRPSLAIDDSKGGARARVDPTSTAVRASNPMKGVKNPGSLWLMRFGDRTQSNVMIIRMQGANKDFNAQEFIPGKTIESAHPRTAIHVLR